MANGVPLAALALRQPQQQDLLGQVSRVMQIKGAMQGQQINQAQLQGIEQENEKRARALEQQKSLFGIFHEYKGKIRNNPEAIRKIMGISPELGIQLQKGFGELDKLDIETQQEKMELLGMQAEQKASLIRGIGDESSKQRAINIALQLKLIDEKRANQLRALPWDDETFEMIGDQALSEKEFSDAEQEEAKATALAGHRKATLEAPTARMKERAADYENFLKASGLPRNAKTERLHRDRFNKSRRTVVEKQPSKTAGVAAKRAASRAIAAARATYQKVIRELDKFAPDPIDPTGELYMHREKPATIAKADWLAQREQAKVERDAAIQAAEASEQEELEFLGFEQEISERNQEPAAQEKTAINPQTGERLILRGGQWVPLQ